MPPTGLSRLCPRVSGSRPKNPLQRRGASFLSHDWLLRPQSAVPAPAQALQGHAHRRGGGLGGGGGAPPPRRPWALFCLLATHLAPSTLRGAVPAPAFPPLAPSS